jgi:transcriptional regulator GlxA family with amidase domain
MYGVRYNDLIAPMVKGMQEQQEMIENSASQLEVDQLRAENEAQKAVNEAQKTENEALRSRLDKMEVLLKELTK